MSRRPGDKQDIELLEALRREIEPCRFENDPENLHERTEEALWEEIALRYPKSAEYLHEVRQMSRWWGFS